MAAEGLVEKKVAAKAAERAGEQQASNATTTSVSGSPTTAPSSTKAGQVGGAFAVVLLGLAILLVNAMIGGRVNPGIFLAVFVFVALGSLFPPVGIAFGFIILFALIVRHSDAFAGKLDVFTGYGGK